MLFNMSFTSDDPGDFDFACVVNIDHTPGPPYVPTDADIIALGNAIVASDYVQHMSWLGTPQLGFIGTPQDPRTVYP